MKKVFLSLGLALSLLFVSCNNSTVVESTDNDTEMPATEEAIVASGEEANIAIENIYKEILKHYSDGTYFNFDYSQFESKRFSTMCERSSNLGMLCVDWDYWIQAQDFDNVQLKSTKITNFDEDALSATAEVRIINMGGEQVINPTLVFENGKWLVDDFVENGNSVYSIMESCVRESKK